MKALKATEKTISTIKYAHSRQLKATARNNTRNVKGGFGDTYKGYFKPIQNPANKIKIVDGMDIEAANCWEGIINEFDAVCPALELTITDDTWIYAQAVPVGTNPWTGVTVTLEQSASKLEYEDNKSKKLISRVKFADSKITAFSRESEEFNAILLKECT